MTDVNGRHAADTETDSTNATGAANGSAPSTPEVAAIQADIERTREDLAQTVDQLTAKLDVKTRVRTRVAETTDRVTSQAAAHGLHLREQVTDEDGKPTPVALSAAGAVVAGIAAVVLVALWRRTSGTRGRKRRWR